MVVVVGGGVKATSIGLSKSVSSRGGVTFVSFAAGDRSVSELRGYRGPARSLAPPPSQTRCSAGTRV